VMPAAITPTNPRRKAVRNPAQQTEGTAKQGAMVFINTV
jgi:hypothetical protein